MKQIKDYYEFKGNITQLGITSLDKNNGVHMITDSRLVVDFDSVKEAYLKNIGIDVGYACSVDAIFGDSDKRVFFVEFKNGDIENLNIKKKIYDSILIFSDITGKTLHELRDNGLFILVISDKKYEHLSASNKRAMALAARGDVDYTLYGLDKFRGYFFKEVHCKKASTFKKYINNINICI